MLPELIALGEREHVLTDYGDEENYTLPWDLFTKESAKAALASAHQCVQIAQQLRMLADVWRKDNEKDSGGE